MGFLSHYYPSHYGRDNSFIDPQRMLHESIQNNNFEGVKLALDNGADIFQSTVSYAVNSETNINMVKYLLSFEEQARKCQRYFVYYASNCDSLALLKYLIEKKKYSMGYSNYESLRFAAERGNLKVVKYLISKGAKIHGSYDYALRYAAMRGHYKVVKYLVQKGGEFSPYNVDTAASWACKCGHRRVARYLLNKFKKGKFE
jgi:ankyrin repeat protein